jgi:hypothetical protein
VDATATSNASVLLLDHVSQTLSGGIAWKPVNNYPSLAGFPAASTNFASITIGPDGRTVTFGPAATNVSDANVTALANTTQPVKWFYIATNSDQNWYIVDATATSNASVLFLSGIDPSTPGGILWMPINNYSSFAGFPAAPMNYSFVTASSDGHSITFGTLQ